MPGCVAWNSSFLPSTAAQLVVTGKD